MKLWLKNFWSSFSFQSCSLFHSSRISCRYVLAHFPFCIGKNRFVRIWFNLAVNSFSPHPFLFSPLQVFIWHHLSCLWWIPIQWCSSPLYWSLTHCVIYLFYSEIFDGLIRNVHMNLPWQRENAAVGYVLSLTVVGVTISQHSELSILSLQARYAASVPCYRIRDKWWFISAADILRLLHVCLYTVWDLRLLSLFTCSSCTVNPELGLYPLPSYHGSSSLAYITQWSNIYHWEWVEKAKKKSQIKANQKLKMREQH